MATASHSGSTNNSVGNPRGTVVAGSGNLGLCPVRNIATITAFTATVAESGTTYVLASIGAVITLPAVASCAGCYWRFVMGAANGTTAWTITPATSVLRGLVTMAATTVAGVNLIMAGNAGATVAFTTTALAGDWIDITSDGVSFYVRGLGCAAASFAVA